MSESLFGAFDELAESLVIGIPDEVEVKEQLSIDNFPPPVEQDDDPDPGPGPDPVVEEFDESNSIIRETTTNLMGVNLDNRYRENRGKHVENAVNDTEYSMTVLRDHHQEILRLLSTGMSPKAIALAVDCREATIRNVRNSDLGKGMLQMLHAERNVTISKTAERFDALAPIAADIYEDIMTDKEADPSLQYRAARDTLKGVGVLVDRKQVGHAHAYFSGDEVEELKGKFLGDFGEDIEEVSFDVVEEAEAAEEGEKSHEE